MRVVSLLGSGSSRYAGVPSVSEITAHVLSGERVQKEHPHDINHEDVAYVARQIDDGLTSEYENPALLPLNEKYREAGARLPGGLQALAALTALLRV